MLASPSQAGAKGGEKIILAVSGFPSPFERSSAFVRFGAHAAHFLDIPAAAVNGDYVSFSVLTPVGLSGLSLITVRYNVSGTPGSAPAALVANLPFIFVSEMIDGACINRYVVYPMWEGIEFELFVICH